ncbi:MAG TPA: ATP-binding cassette domain-containing protein [Desulfocapsa sulfexigens]|nr:ATP-binding cassette domain-containing protein [Desulfocapsa sulfexigens]
MVHIKLRDVGFRFDSRSTNSLDDITLDVEQGECVLLAGRSGSGKSTLLHVLSGLIPEYYQGHLQGCIRIGKDDVRWQDVPLWQKSASVGTVFQDPRHQFFSARVEQELLLSRFRKESEREDSEQQLNTLLNSLGLQKMRHRLLDTLSSGEQQRVAIGTAISLAPKILVLDEPSANLSADGVTILFQFLQSAKAEGTTIVIAEHRFSWIRELVDKLVVLDRGSIVFKGNAEKLGEQLFCEEFGLRFQPLEESGENEHQEKPSGRNGSSPVLTMNSVGFRHGKKQDWLFNNLQWELHPGEVFAVTGRNGCGKTTLLTLIYGLLKVGKGSVVFTQNDPLKALALQHPDLQLFASTVAEEISDNVAEQGKWLDRFNLVPLKECHPLTLSGGEMQRLVLAAAFCRVAERSDSLLLLDEPTSGMDGYQLRTLAEEIKELRKRGGSVVMATHDSDLIKETNASLMELDRI